MGGFFNFIGGGAKIFNEFTDLIAWSSWFLKWISADNSPASRHTEKILKVRHPFWQLLTDGAALCISGIVSCGDYGSFNAYIKLYNLCKAGWYCKNLYKEMVEFCSDGQTVGDDGAVVPRGPDLCGCWEHLFNDYDYKKIGEDLDYDHSKTGEDSDNEIFA